MSAPDFRLSPHPGRHPSVRARLGMIAMAIAAAIGTAAVGASEPVLHVESSGDGLVFRLAVAGDAGDGTWILQHSGSGRSWEDLAVLDDREGTQAPQGAVSWSSLPQRGAGAGLFRAIRRDTVHPALPGFLEARSRWRESGFDRYRYEIRWSWSFFFWRGTMTVIDGTVASHETIDTNSWIGEPLELRTIDDWFDAIGDAIESGAEIVDVTWNRELGFPEDGFIDVSTLIADEEQSWTIESFAPLR